jgi:hypothetical protein
MQNPNKPILKQIKQMNKILLLSSLFFFSISAQSQSLKLEEIMKGNASLEFLQKQRWS